MQDDLHHKYIEDYNLNFNESKATPNTLSTNKFLKSNNKESLSSSLYSSITSPSQFKNTTISDSPLEDENYYQYDD
jgi:hypothetical protein